MTLPMYPFAQAGWIVNEPGHYKGHVCHGCPDSIPGKQLYVQHDWTLKSCTTVSTSGGFGCASHLYVAMIEIVHDDYVGGTTQQIEIKSSPPGATIDIL